MGQENIKVVGLGRFIMKHFSGIHWLFILLAAFILAGTVTDTARAAEFTKELTSGKITFQIKSDNLGEVNQVRITASGPGIDSTPVTATVNGAVTWAEVTDDLDNDGFPELYVYAACPGDPSADTGLENHPDPAVVIAVTPRGHGGQIVPIVPVIPPGSGTPSGGVVIGPGITRHTNAGTVRAVPVVPVDAPAGEDICVNELQFILVKGKTGRTLRRVQSR
jgi:hypothetical protein